MAPTCPGMSQCKYVILWSAWKYFAGAKDPIIFTTGSNMEFIEFSETQSALQVN